MTYSATEPAPKLTPMFEQYMAIKAEYQDALLFYRMGDFYELFFQDAETAARELQIALTSRNAQAANPVPMCGVPHHAVEAYLSQLLKKGYTVAICEQVSDPKESKGLVQRAVTLVRTPGTAVEDASLEAKGSNYLGAVYWDSEKSAGGFSWLEFSTGAWSGITTKKQAELWQWVQKMHPRELLVPDLSSDVFRVPQSISLEGIKIVRLSMRPYFDETSGIQKIKQAQKIQELGAVGLNGKPELVRACGAILSYLLQTQKQELTYLSPFTPLNLGQHLILDEITERNLELFRLFNGKKGRGTLWDILDETMTPMGGRLLEERLKKPWRKIDRITESASVVQYFFENDHKRQAIRAALDKVYDLERLSTRISIGRSVPRDFIALRESLVALTSVAKALEATPPGVYATEEESYGFNLPPALVTTIEKWDALGDIGTLLTRSLVDSPPQQVTEGGLFKAGYNAKLDELLDLAEHGEQKMQQLLAEEQAAHRLPRLKLGYNRVFGYYFEMPRATSESAPAHFIRRQTLANAERFVTPALKELEDKMLAAGEKRSQFEHKLFIDLKDQVAMARVRILFMASILAAIDYWQSLAEVARKGNWVRPSLHEGTDITIREGRHPVVEALANSSGFIPNDIRFDDKRQMILITGPNMSGKSTVLRQVALITILAQMGSFVPATEARIGIIDRIFSRVGASDNLAQGQSTFMVEMMETARILRQATPRSLVILDEIGRGTSTFDGLSLAWAVVENLLQRTEGAVRTCFATHYHELTALEGRLPGVHNMNIAIREWNGDIVFLHRLVPGPADKSYGIEVAKLAGVPQSVVTRAKKILAVLDASRNTSARQQTEEAMLQALPGVTMPEPVPETPLLLPKEEIQVTHPLLATLQDLNTDAITPIQAITLITEWKLLWGGDTK